MEALEAGASESVTAYYNEHDPYAAAWLRNLIDAGHIARGVVDERDIRDVLPSDLAGFTQCHFFAGIGVWSYALRLSGWADDRPVWTGSCPCQPFSGAGKRAGDADERHLWPAWRRLIRECRPPVVYGEQVAGVDGLAWLDVVLSDMEDDSHAVAAADLPAAGVGAPHIRQRLFFVGHANIERAGRNWRAVCGPVDREDRQQCADDACASGSTRVLANAGGSGQRVFGRGEVHRSGPARPHADKHHEGRPTAGFWARADWIACRDGKARPVEPGTFPLVARPSFRVGSGSALAGKSRSQMLKGYGNAINAEAAAAFIRASMKDPA